MNPYVKHSLRAIGYLFLHFWIVGTILGIGLAFVVKDWSMNMSDPNSLGSYLIDVKLNFLKFNSVFVAIWPYGEFEIQQAKLIWMTTFIPAIFFFKPILQQWSSGKFKDASRYGSHGSARWAKRREIFRNGEITGSPVNELNGPGVILGNEKKRFGIGGYITLPPDSELNQNVLVYGNSGIGKGQTYVIPQIFHAMDPFNPPSKARLARAQERNLPIERSLVIFDPKGEHYKYTAHSLSQAGFEVYCFNLIKMSASHRWNCMDYVDEDLDAEKLANLIVAPSEKHGGDPFWPKAEKALMSALILFVKHELPPEQRNLANVLHIGLTFGRDEETLNLLFDSLPYNHPAVARYNIFRVAPEETRAGILIGFGTQLSLFGYKEIQKLTSQSDFRLDDLGRKKTALFLIIPDSDTTYAPLTSLFMDQMFQQLWKVADENGGTCPVGVTILGDEFVNVGRIPMLAERTSVMRSKGVSLQILVQAKSQLYNLYKDDADSIIQNFDTVVFLGTNDKKTAEEMSADIGDGTIQVVSTSQQQNAPFLAGNANESKQYQGRRLITPDELRRKSRRENIVLQNGGYPFRTIKTRFTEHPNAKGYKILDPKDLVPPPHKGFELFSQDDYNRICGLNLEPSEVNPEEARNNFENNMASSDESNPLDLVHSFEESIEEEIVQAGPIEQFVNNDGFENREEEDSLHSKVDDHYTPGESAVQEPNNLEIMNEHHLASDISEHNELTESLNLEAKSGSDPEKETEDQSPSSFKNPLDLIP